MSNVQNILNDPNLMHHIHQMSQTMQKNEVSVQEQLRQQVLQQQQEEFDKEIKQVIILGVDFTHLLYVV